MMWKCAIQVLKGGETLRYCNLKGMVDENGEIPKTKLISEFWRSLGLIEAPLMLKGIVVPKDSSECYTYG